MVARIETRFLGIPVFRTTPKVGEFSFREAAKVDYEIPSQSLVATETHLRPTSFPQGDVMSGVVKKDEDTFALLEVRPKGEGDSCDVSVVEEQSKNGINRDPIIIHSHIPFLTYKTVWEPPKK